MNIISRSGWGARAPRDRNTTSWTHRTGFVVHHSAGPSSQSVKTIQNYHMNSRGWDDVGYNFLIDRHGRIYEGRGWTVIGAHAKGHNTSNIGVCVIGNYTDTAPNEEIKDALAWLYAEANRRASKTLAIRTHRMVGSTACPGDKLHAWVTRHLDDHDGDGDHPAPPPKGSPAPGPKYDFPLPHHYYFGPKNGPDSSVSGFYKRSFDGRTDSEWLKLWVRQLRKRGWNARKGGSYLRKYGNDGLFGDEYEHLVRAFQRDQNLVVDGKLGPRTWHAAFNNPVTG